MRTSIIILIALVTLLVSCTDDSNAFVQKIETTQTELKREDSILISYRTEVSSMTFVPSSNEGPIKYSILNTLNAFTEKVNPLITRLELMIQKNKGLAEQVKTNTGDAVQVEQQYQAQVDEFELMKPQIAEIKADYGKIVARNAETVKSDSETTKVE